MRPPDGAHRCHSAHRNRRRHLAPPARGANITFSRWALLPPRRGRCLYAIKPPRAIDQPGNRNRSGPMWPLSARRVGPQRTVGLEQRVLPRHGRRWWSARRTRCRLWVQPALEPQPVEESPASPCRATARPMSGAVSSKARSAARADPCRGRCRSTNRRPRWGRLPHIFPPYGHDGRQHEPIHFRHQCFRPCFHSSPLLIPVLAPSSQWGRANSRRGGGAGHPGRSWRKKAGSL